MTVREPPDAPRSRGRNGAGSIYWHKAKGCYIGSISLGKRPVGGRIRPEIRGHSIAEVSAKLDALRRDFDNGIDLGDKYTVADAARDFLAYGTARCRPRQLISCAFTLRSGSFPTSAAVEGRLRDLKGR